MSAHSSNSYGTESPVSPASPRLLIVDHQQSFTGFLRLIAHRLGYQVNILADSREIAASIDAHQPDLLVLEVVMPELDGIEAIGILGQKGFDGRLILVSAHEPTYLELARKTAEANNLKVAATLTKPVRQATIEVALKATLSAS